MSVFHICVCLASVTVISNAATTVEAPPAVTTRLVNGNEYVGRLEVWYNGEWGTVCDDAFEEVDATVVCYSLGYGYVGHALANAFYGEGTGQIWLDEVTCTGTETFIGDCGHLPWGSHNCVHSEDVSVDCSMADVNSTAPPPPDVPTRLVNGNQFAGRVEVWHNGLWGTVCDDGFGEVDATVVCYSLGYGYVGHSLPNAYYGEGTGAIWLDEVACTGTETFIGDCGHLGWGSHNCVHSEDVSVDCSIADVNSTAPPPPDVPTRLADGNQFAGRVEVWHNGQWGTVCDDAFSEIDATVVCYSLGYGYVGLPLPNAFYGEGIGQIWLDEVTCDGTETFIGDCNHLGWGIHNCWHSEDVSVDCSMADVNSTAPPQPDVLTRLVNGTASAGRVEVWHNGQWGTVCDDGFEDVEASVVCYSLGYGYVGRAIWSSYYGQGSGLIWLDNVDCTGNETFIGDCAHNSWGENDCSHYEDVSVDCSLETTAAVGH